MLRIYRQCEKYNKYIVMYTSHIIVNAESKAVYFDSLQEMTTKITAILYIIQNMKKVI